MTSRAHLPAVLAALSHEPRQGYEVARAAGVTPTEAHTALAWLEARGHAALRPMRPISNRHWHRCGWVVGAVELAAAA